MTIAYVGLGSNLGDRERLIREAAQFIGAVRLSTLIETEPWGYGDQPLFLNAVAELETPLIGPRWGPRTIDLDLLLYGDETIDEPGLVVPHPRLSGRDFVLRPLAELVPTLKIPGDGTVQDALAGLSSEP